MEKGKAFDREVLIQKMVDGWRSGFVSRDRIKEFSGGALSGRTLANWESQGRGCAEKFIIAKKIVYPTRAIAEFIIDNFVKPVTVGNFSGR